MSAKIIWPCAFVLALISSSTVQADRMAYATDADAAKAAPDGPAQAARPAAVPVPGELSSWIKYGRPGCCDAYGGDGPIGTELSVRTGPSLPVAGGTINNSLNLGWKIEGVGRSLFFDPSQTAAWTAELSLSHTYNNANEHGPVIRLNPVLPPPSPQGTQPPLERRDGTIRTLHRTMVGAGLGREWYLNGAANDFGHYWALWRFGVDVGGRLGTARMDFNERRTPGQVNFQRAHDFIFAAYAAVHTDVEIPCGCCIFVTGFRAEWQYNWMDIIPFDVRSNLQDVNLLLSAGVRF